MKIIKLLDLIYPPVCGICSKGKNVYLCKKCEKILQIKAVFGSEKYEDKYFSNHMYIFKYDGIIRELILKYKFNEKPYLYKIFTNFLEKFKKNNLNLEKYDIIIPVPISKKRFRQRGYNQSTLISKELAKNNNIKLQKNVLIKYTNNTAQSNLNKER